MKHSGIGYFCYKMYFGNIGMLEIGYFFEASFLGFSHFLGSDKLL